MPYAFLQSTTGESMEINFGISLLREASGKQGGAWASRVNSLSVSMFVPPNRPQPQQAYLVIRNFETGAYGERNRDAYLGEYRVDMMFRCTGDGEYYFGYAVVDILSAAGSCFGSDDPLGHAHMKQQEVDWVAVFDEAHGNYGHHYIDPVNETDKFTISFESARHYYEMYKTYTPRHGAISPDEWRRAYV